MHNIQGAELDDVEAWIGLRLPDDVRARYALSDGYKGPTDCQLLYSAKTDNTDIVSMNGLRTEPWFPPQFQRMVLVGDDGCGNLIGFDWNTCQAVLWNPADGDQVQLTRPTVTEIWNYVVDWYAALD